MPKRLRAYAPKCYGTQVRAGRLQHASARRQALNTLIMTMNEAAKWNYGIRDMYFV